MRYLFKRTPKSLTHLTSPQEGATSPQETDSSIDKYKPSVLRGMCVERGTGCKMSWYLAINRPALYEKVSFTFRYSALNSAIDVSLIFSPQVALVFFSNSHGLYTLLTIFSFRQDDRKHIVHYW